MPTPPASPLWADLLDFLQANAYDTRFPWGKVALTPETSLEKDLGITGEDAVDFMEALRTRFPAVRWNLENFEYARYFGPESFWASATPRQPLTLGMLVRALELGRWCYGEQNAGNAPKPSSPLPPAT